MDRLWASITEWLKEVLINGITSNLAGMFDSTNQHGMPVEEVAMLLGHEEIKTTMKYVVKDKAMVKHHYQQIVA